VDGNSPAVTVRLSSPRAAIWNDYLEEAFTRAWRKHPVASPLCCSS